MAWIWKALFELYLDNCYENLGKKLPPNFEGTTKPPRSGSSGDKGQDPQSMMNMMGTFMSAMLTNGGLNGGGTMPPHVMPMQAVPQPVTPLALAAGQTGSVLGEFLKEAVQAELLEFESKLKESGFKKIEDIEEGEDADFAAVGLNNVEIKRLRREYKKWNAAHAGH